MGVVVEDMAAIANRIREGFGIPTEAPLRQVSLRRRYSGADAGAEIVIETYVEGGEPITVTHCWRDEEGDHRAIAIALALGFAMRLPVDLSLPAPWSD